MNRPIYLDYNATHPPLENILKNNLNIYIENFYNPSGPTRFSLQRQGLIEKSREVFSQLTGKPKNSFVFCSTGTEANHFLIGILANSQVPIRKVYVSPMEHPSMYGALEYFQVESVLLKTDFSGLVNLSDLQQKMEKEPLDIICLFSANETGVIQPVKEIAEIAHKYGKYFLSDMMQAFAKIPADFSLVDGFTASGHKIGGGLGSSVVCIPKPFLQSDYKIFIGGNQENGKRAGTENSLAVSSFADAASFQFSIMEEKISKQTQLRTELETGLESMGCKIIAKDSPRMPSTIFFLLPTEDVDFFMLGMEEKNIILSTGSSCKSRAREPALSLLQMGYSKEEALRAIRISFGIFTLSEDIPIILEAMREVLGALEA